MFTSLRSVCLSKKICASIAFATPYLAVLLVAVQLLTGCQSYAPQPLTSESVDQKLKTPAADETSKDQGLTPDQAAILAVIGNPGLRATRDQRGVAAAALVQAGLLPNPSLTYSSDFVTGGFTAGAFNAYGATLSWDFQQLISRSAKMQAASLSAQSVNLSVAWQQWQTAEAAKQAVYDLISLQAQAAVLDEIDQRLRDNFKTVQKAATAGLQTSVELSAAEAAARDAKGSVLQARRDVEHQWFQLNRALGLSANSRPKLHASLELASAFDAPDSSTLVPTLEQHRIDLIALHRGYESQEETLRAAILDQFPKINLGVNGASDNSNVHSVGLVATIDLPIFDRNQGVIASEKATRQKLFDEYVSRVFESRSDIATAIADLKALTEQIADAQAAVPNLQRLVDNYSKALQLGNADVLSYYVVWGNLAQKRLAVLRLQQQLADTRVALELAAGRSFPDPAVITMETK